MNGSLQLLLFVIWELWGLIESVCHVFCFCSQKRRWHTILLPECPLLHFFGGYIHGNFITAISSVSFFMISGSWGKSIQIWFHHNSRMQSLPLRASFEDRSHQRKRKVFFPKGHSMWLSKKPRDSRSEEGVCVTEPCCPCRFAMWGACSSPASHLRLQYPWYSFLCPVGTRQIPQFNHWWQVWIATTPVQPLAATLLLISLKIIPAWKKGKLKQGFCSSVAGGCVALCAPLSCTWSKSQV